jgi:hypothetical protein
MKSLSNYPVTKGAQFGHPFEGNQYIEPTKPEVGMSVYEHMRWGGAAFHHVITGFTPTGTKFTVRTVTHEGRQPNGIEEALENAKSMAERAEIVRQADTRFPQQLSPEKTYTRQRNGSYTIKGESFVVRGQLTLSPSRRPFTNAADASEAAIDSEN